MTGILIVNDNSKQIAEPAVNLDVWAGRLASEQTIDPARSSRR